MKLFELYALSFIEPMDVIQAIDNENAKLIQLFNEFEEIRVKNGVSVVELAKLRHLRQGFESGANIGDALQLPRRVINDAELVEMARSGKDCSEIAKSIGFSNAPVRERLRSLGFRYCGYKNAWEEIPELSEDHRKNKPIILPDV